MTRNFTKPYKILTGIYDDDYLIDFIKRYICVFTQCAKTEIYKNNPNLSQQEGKVLLNHLSQIIQFKNLVNTFESLFFIVDDSGKWFFTIFKARGK